MDRQEYLNQISAKPAAKTKATFGKNFPGNLLHSKFFWVGAGGLLALIIIVIIGVALGSGRSDSKDVLYGLILHIDNTSEIIGDYQSDLKSSDLRGYSANLSSILSSTSSGLTNYATEQYKFKKKDVKKSITEDEDAAKAELNNELFEAKINGILDRVYAQKMAYEISIITARESQLLDSTSNQTLTDILSSSYESLANLYAKFNEFTGTN